MPYKKYDPKVDELGVGTKIRVSGREGIISRISNRDHYFLVHFDQGNVCLEIDLPAFPDLEIFVQPLTIPHDTKAELIQKIAVASDIGGHIDANKRYELFEWLNSLEVTND